MSKPPPPAPTASAIGPCPTVIKIVGRPGTGSLPNTIAPPDHPRQARQSLPWNFYKIRSGLCLANKGEDCLVPLQIVSLSPYDQCVGRILNSNLRSQSELTHSYYIANTDLEKFVYC